MRFCSDVGCQKAVAQQRSVIDAVGIGLSAAPAGQRLKAHARREHLVQVRKNTCEQLLHVDAAGHLDARAHCDFLDAGHADAHRLLAEIAPAREVAAELIDRGSRAADSIGELDNKSVRRRGLHRRARGDENSRDNGARLRQHRRNLEQDPHDDAARTGWARVSDVEPAKEAVRFRQRAPDLAAVRHHGHGVDGCAFPERRRLGLVPERQRQIDVVVLPAGRDLQCIRVAVQFAFGEFHEHFVETARPDPRCPEV